MAEPTGKFLRSISKGVADFVGGALTPRGSQADKEENKENTTAVNPKSPKSEKEAALVAPASDSSAKATTPAKEVSAQ